MENIGQCDHEDIYEQISSLFKIKFKAQLRGSPIEFYNFLFLKNMLIKDEYFVLVFSGNKELIKFTDREDFILKFTEYIQKKINELEDDFKELSNFESTSRSIGMQYDENQVFIRHEEIGHGIHKLTLLESKLKTFIN